MATGPGKSTMVSDVILAASCAWSLFQLRQTVMPNPFKMFKEGDLLSSLPLAQVWFIMAMLSAIIGIFRFGRRDFFERLRGLYDTVSWMTLAFGFPCLVAQFYFYHNQRVLGNLHLLASVPTLLAWISGNDTEKNRSTGLLLVACGVSLALNATYYGNLGQLLGSVLMLAAFSLFRSNRTRLGLPPVDWFHYVVVISNLLFISALGISVYPKSINIREPFRSLF